MRQFHLGDVLSIVHGALLSPRHMTGVYDILGYMTGRDLSTIMLLPAADPCKEALLKQHPQLAEVVNDKVGPENYKEWLDKCISKYGETLPVKPLGA